MKRRAFLGSLGAALALPSSVAHAQTAARRNLRVVVPLPAGTSNDMVARVLAPGLGNLLGQNVVIDNRAGGNGIIGAMEVVRAAPDGQTLLLGSLSPLAINVALIKDLPYDPRRNITPLAGISTTNWVLMVKSGTSIRTLADYIAYARQHPGKITIGYSTAAVQVLIATFCKMARIELLPVPYKGTPATLSDVIGGTLDSTLTDPGNALAQVKGGRMRALAVTSLKRNPVTPDWPAISETLPGFDFTAWNALVGPAGMPADLVSRTSAAVNQALKEKDLVERYAAGGAIPFILSPGELKTFIEAETAKWLRLTREAGIQPE